MLVFWILILLIASGILFGYGIINYKNSLEKFYLGIVFGTVLILIASWLIKLKISIETTTNNYSPLLDLGA
jgi:hypothetical protein